MTQSIMFMKKMPGRSYSFFMFILLFLFCGRYAEAEPVDLGQSPVISECGGFTGDETGSRQRGRSSDEAEQLQWRYDADQKIVTFINTNVSLNCCGDHFISIFFDERMKVYIINELDQPRDGASRCRCQCVYDFKIDLHGIHQDRILIALYRHVTDRGGKQNLFLGSLDLNRGQGAVKLYPK
ncbi:MAG: hypothetical protein K8S27_13555 [Candidatus Omnitrophica bacterium]|nr:hypothetical protein [Candidatus Omnitrophota bacterium]